ncbi:hypothetical protein [Streptomyces melanogenes]|uniref:hypothetical protein n=1 Tax=Streptomyces melanogenes TaxID=67326 RepID=UPI0037B8FD9F
MGKLQLGASSATIKSRDQERFMDSILERIHSFPLFVVLIPALFQAVRELNASGGATKAIGWAISRLRLTLRSFAVLAGLVLSISFLVGDHMVRAGLSLLIVASVRLMSPRGGGKSWSFSDLSLHIGSEVAFHVLAIVVTALGLNLITIGHFRDLEIAPRVSITITLAIASLVAVNKASARTRRLCTEMVECIDELLDLFAALEYGWGKNDAEEQFKAGRGCFLKIEQLERLLKTRLNTGYSHLGTPVLPINLHKSFIDELRTAAAHIADPSWKKAADHLRQLRVACVRRVDVVA